MKAYDLVGEMQVSEECLNQLASRLREQPELSRARALAGLLWRNFVGCVCQALTSSVIPYHSGRSSTARTGLAMIQSRRAARNFPGFATPLATSQSANPASRSLPENQTKTFPTSATNASLNWAAKVSSDSCTAPGSVAAAMGARWSAMLFEAHALTAPESSASGRSISFSPSGRVLNS